MEYSILILVILASSVLMVFTLVNIFFLRFSSGSIKRAEEPTMEDVSRNRIRRIKAARKAAKEYLLLQVEPADLKVMYNHPIPETEKAPKQEITALGKMRVRSQKEKVAV